MTTLPKIENLSDDNARSYFRSQRIAFAGKSATTPARSLEIRRCAAKPGYDTSGYAFQEAYREVDAAVIAACGKVPERLRAVSAGMRQQTVTGDANPIRSSFIQFRPTERSRWPDAVQTEFACDLAHSYSDLVPIPSVAGTVNLSDVAPLLSYVRSAIRSIERLNTKPLMGWVPVGMPRDAIPKLVESYWATGVRAIYVDFGGRIPDQFQLRPIQTALTGQKPRDESLVYGLNARPGRFIRNSMEIPSKDFLAHGLGLDVLGGTHLRSFGPQGTMGTVVAARASNRRRLFLRSTYGYHQVRSLKQAAELFPRRSPIGLEELLAAPDSGLERLFNMDQHLTESRELQTRMANLSRNESILGYVAKKRLARASLGTFRRHPTLM